MSCAQESIHAAKQIARRAFTLIEVVIAVIVLAIAVPPTLNMMDSAASGRVDAINTTRATFLSTAVLESVMADMTSRDELLGFAALADEDAYLNTETTGLYARLVNVTRAYTDVGLSYTVSVGELVGSDGEVSEDEEDNVFRVVTVRVAYVSASSDSFDMPVSVMVSEM